MTIEHYIAITEMNLKADESGVVDITEALYSILPDIACGVPKDEYVPADGPTSFVFDGVNPFIRYLVDVLGFKRFKYKDKIYRYGWDDDFYFTTER